MCLSKSLYTHRSCSPCTLCSRNSVKHPIIWDSNAGNRLNKIYGCKPETCPDMENGLKKHIIYCECCLFRERRIALNPIKRTVVFMTVGFVLCIIRSEEANVSHELWKYVYDDDDDNDDDYYDDDCVRDDDDVDNDDDDDDNVDDDDT